MAKYCGRVGFTMTEKIKPGVSAPVTKYVKYRGEVERKTIKSEPQTSQLNNEFNVSNIINIIGNEYAFKNFQHISCVEYLGAFWRVTSVEVIHPRLKLTIGGVFNGQEA